MQRNLGWGVLVDVVEEVVTTVNEVVLVDVRRSSVVRSVKVEFLSVVVWVSTWRGKEPVTNTVVMLTAMVHV